MAGTSRAPEWLLIPSSSAPGNGTQQLMQPQMLQQQAQLVQPQPQQLMLVTNPSTSQAPQPPQLMQMPGSAELQGAQVMYVPAQYVLVPQGSAVPGHTATTPITPAAMLAGPQAAYQALPQLQRQVQCQVQRQAQGRAASPVIPSSRVFVGNLHTQVTEVELGMVFSGTGRVLCSKVSREGAQVVLLRAVLLRAVLPVCECAACVAELVGAAAAHVPPWQACALRVRHITRLSSDAIRSSRMAHIAPHILSKSAHHHLPLRPQVMYNSRRMSRPRSQWRSREFGFVDFSTPGEAQLAIARLHGAVLPGLTKDGAQLIVQYVKGEGAVGSIVMM
jgi:hypothetical protein